MQCVLYFVETGTVYENNWEAVYDVTYNTHINDEMKHVGPIKFVSPTFMSCQRSRINCEWYIAADVSVHIKDVKLLLYSACILMQTCKMFDK